MACMLLCCCIACRLSLTSSAYMKICDSPQIHVTKRGVHYLKTTLITIYSILCLFIIIHIIITLLIIVVDDYVVSLPCSSCTLSLSPSFTLSLGTGNQTQIYCCQLIGQKKWKSGLKTCAHCVICYNSFTFLRTKQRDHHSHISSLAVN